MSEIVLLSGAGAIGLAIAKRVSLGRTVLVGDLKLENAQKGVQALADEGIDAVPAVLDLGSRESIEAYVQKGAKMGPVKHLINAAGVSPSQASIETILKVDLYGTSVLLDRVGQIIAEGGSGITVSSQSGHRMGALTAEEDEQLACTDPEELLSLPLLQPGNVRDTLHAYQLAKRCNVKRVMAEAVKWGRRKARVNSISPGIIVTPLALDEFNGPRGAFYQNMFKKCPAGRPGQPDEVGRLAAFMLGDGAEFITGSDFLIDGGATSAYFYGELRPQ